MLRPQIQNLKLFFSSFLAIKKTLLGEDKKVLRLLSINIYPILSYEGLLECRQMF